MGRVKGNVKKVLPFTRSTRGWDFQSPSVPLILNPRPSLGPDPPTVLLVWDPRGRKLRPCRQDISTAPSVPVRPDLPIPARDLSTVSTTLHALPGPDGRTGGGRV